MRVWKGSACLLAAAVAGGTLLLLGQAARAARTPIDAHRSVGEAKVFRNLRLFPVYDKAARSSTSYLTLDEGLKAKKVRVEEAPGGGEVNQLFVSNDTEVPFT